MHTYGIRLLMVFMAILAIFLTAAAISLHQMYPMRATGTLSAEEQRWVNEEENRRQGELIRDEIRLARGGRSGRCRYDRFVLPRYTQTVEFKN